MAKTGADVRPSNDDSFSTGDPPLTPWAAARPDAGAARAPIKHSARANSAAAQKLGFAASSNARRRSLRSK